jgi:hypothetical protein
MESTWSANPCPPGKPLFLNVTVRWSGKAGRYAVRIPELAPPEGLTQVSASSRSFRRGEENVLSYQWELLAEEKGQIPPFPVKLNVHEEGDQEPAVLEIRTESLTVDTGRWRGIPVLTLVVSGFLLAALAGGAQWLSRRGRKGVSGRDAPPGTDPGPLVPEFLEALNKSRIRGDTLSFLEGASKIVDFVCPEDHPDSLRLKGLLQQARYGDLNLSSEEMDEWNQKVKRMTSDQP